MKRTLQEVSLVENKFLSCRLIIALLFYCASFGLYIGVFWAKEPEETIQGLAILNPVFILASDIVILSLREQTVRIRIKEQQSPIVYSPTFQSLVLLISRVLLCYNKEYWLLNQALVYFVVQCICSYDATQTLFLKTENVRDEQTDIVEILRVCPVLQAKVQNTLPELKTGFIMPQKSCCEFGKFFTWRKFRTQIASFVYFLFFFALMYLCSTQPDNLKTKPVVFHNEVGQWTYGYLAISFCIVLVFFILWLRHFKNSGYIFTCTSLLLYLLMQLISVGVGYFTYYVLDEGVDIVITSFVILPITACSFGAFYGIWASNDFSGYQHDYVQGKNLQPQELEAYTKLGCCDKLKHGAWKPRTNKDWAFFLMLFINIVSIFTYMIMTAIMFSPAYVSVTISLLILVFETSFIMIWKYKATNFSMTISVVIAMLTSVITMIVWIIYISLAMLLDDDAPEYLKGAAVIVIVAYFVAIISSLLYLEYQSVHAQWKNLTCSFWILAGLTYLILLAAGASAIYFTDYGLAGIVWISVCVYALLNALLRSYRRILEVLYSLIFAVAGILLVIFSETNSQSFQGISVLYFGMFILSFGEFIQEYFKNKARSRKAIFMNAPEVMPMLRFDLNKQQMKDSNAEPIYFFFFSFIILLWAFSATIIADKSWRHIPLSLIGITLAFTFIYMIEKNVAATTIDRKFFKQATQLFYTSCLVTATDYKKKWRNADRALKAVQEDPEREFIENEQFQNRTVYYNELMVLSDWARLAGHFKSELGFIGWFESVSSKAKKIKAHAIAPAMHPIQQEATESHFVPPDSEDAEAQVIPGLIEGNEQKDDKLEERQSLVPPANLPSNFVSKTGDQAVEALASRLRNTVGKETKQNDKIDAWLDLMDRAREEDFYDKKYWAFLNGYLALKMAQLLENELSIIENTVKLFIHKLKSSYPNANLEAHMNVGNFLDEIKDEPDVLVGFTIFLAEEFLDENDKKNSETEQNADSSVADWNSSGQLRQNIEKMKKDFSNVEKETFDIAAFQSASQTLIGNLLMERQIDITKAIEESQKRDAERERSRHANEEARRLQQDQRDRRRNIKMDEVNEADAEEDERLLRVEGDQKLSELQSSGRSVHEDQDFEHAKAKGELEGNYEYVRIEDVVSSNGAAQGTRNTVFADGVSANDIRQGSLGDCYLLSAMSIIAHSRPDLIKKIFHPDSRVFRNEGLYSIMLYQGKVPHIVNVDDKFLVSSRSKNHAFVRLCTDMKTNEREIWPLLVEKAYAKFHGSYGNIEGGHVHTALVELTNGAGQRWSLRDKAVEQMFNTGELWNKMQFWRDRNYLMGAGSPSGSDADISSLGIVQGHAYSILDVATIDGTNLIQLRNPWGGDTEWKGAWGDNSDMWNEKRKREAYSRMKDQACEVIEIGKEDGTFWMSFSDFNINFASIYLCRFFDKEYKDVFFESEWSKVNNTCGGCTNNDSVPYNPQMQMIVEEYNSGTPVEMFLELTLTDVGSRDRNFSFGFEIYDLKGKKVTSRSVPAPIHTNDGGYSYGTNATFDGAIAATRGGPLTVLISTFKPDQEAKFRFTVHYKHATGTVKMQKFTD